MTEPFVREDVRAYLDMLNSSGRPALDEEIIAQMRQLPPDFLSQLDLPVGELGEIRDLTMPGPGGEMALRLFDPRKERGPGPVVVFFHGGGFVLGSIGTHAGLAAEIARHLDLPVISVEYRLAPEDRWPAAVDDAEAAARWIAENGAVLGREFTGLVLVGDSAGGALTCVAAAALRDRPAALPVIMQIPIYPTADLSKTYPSSELFGSGFGLDTADKAFFTKAYAPDVEDPRGSAIKGDLAGLPPTLVVTAGVDPLRDQGRAYAAKAIEAGVNVSYYEAQGNMHGFCSYRAVIPSSSRDLAAILDLAAAMLKGIAA